MNTKKKLLLATASQFSCEVQARCVSLSARPSSGHSLEDNQLIDDGIRVVRITRSEARGAQVVAHPGLPGDQCEGRFRISARACNRVESAALFVMAALFSNDGAKLLSLASSLRFILERSAL